MKERLKSPMLWASILSLIFLILSVTNIIKISDVTANIIINSVLSILAFIGVINTPTSEQKEEINDIKEDIKELNDSINKKCEF